MRKWGYKDGWTLRAAPYDFRFGTSSMPNFYEPLRHLVEQTFRETRGRRVTLLAHSMGGLLAHHFLSRQPRHWKEKYIESLVTLNTPWQGSIVMLQAVLSGYTWGFSSVDALLLRHAQRSSPSAFSMFPSPAAWGRHHTVVATPGRNYTTWEYDALFEDAGFPVGRHMWENSRRDVESYRQAPGVPSHCLYSSGRDTATGLRYGEEFPDSSPELLLGPGDGSVTINSARGCESWRSSGDFVLSREFTNTGHADILGSSEMHKHLETLLIRRNDVDS